MTLTPNRRITLVNAIQEKFESGDYISEWEQGFLEDVEKRIQNGKNLSSKQYIKLIDLISDYI